MDKLSTDLLCLTIQNSIDDTDVVEYFLREHPETAKCIPNLLRHMLNDAADGTVLPQLHRMSTQDTLQHLRILWSREHSLWRDGNTKDAIKNDMPYLVAYFLRSFYAKYAGSARRRPSTVSPYVGVSQYAINNYFNTSVSAVSLRCTTLILHPPTKRVTWMFPEMTRDASDYMRPFIYPAVNGAVRSSMMLEILLKAGRSSILWRIYIKEIMDTYVKVPHRIRVRLQKYIDIGK